MYLQVLTILPSGVGLKWPAKKLQKSNKERWTAQLRQRRLHGIETTQIKSTFVQSQMTEGREAINRSKLTPTGKFWGRQLTKFWTTLSIAPRRHPGGCNKQKTEGQCQSCQLVMNTANHPHDAKRIVHEEKGRDQRRNVRKQHHKKSKEKWWIWKFVYTAHVSCKGPDNKGTELCSNTTSFMN